MLDALRADVLSHADYNWWWQRRSLSLNDCTKGAVTMFSGRLFQSRIVCGKNEYFKVSVFAFIVSNFEQWLPRVLHWARFTISLCGTTTSSLTILNNIHSLSCLLLSCSGSNSSCFNSSVTVSGVLSQFLVIYLAAYLVSFPTYSQTVVEKREIYIPRLYLTAP